MSGIIFSEGSGVANSIYGNSQYPIKAFLEQRMEAFEEASPMKHTFQLAKSTNWAEKYASMTGMGEFQAVGENGAYPKTDMQESFSQTIVNVTWKNSFAISQEMVEDAKIMDMKKEPAAFMTAYERTRERYGAGLIANALTNDSFTFNGEAFSLKGADGKRFFAPDHPSIYKASDIQGNVYKDAFSIEALDAAEAAMQNFRGDRKEVLGLHPDTILIPNYGDLKRAVFAAIGADKDPETANNGYNYQFGRWNVIINPYLNEFNDNKFWILIDSKHNDQVGSAIMQDRIPLSVKSIIDDETDANVWLGRSRFVGGFNDWRGFLAAGVSSAANSLITAS